MPSPPRGGVLRVGKPKVCRDPEEALLTSPDCEESLPGGDDT